MSNKSDFHVPTSLEFFQTKAAAVVDQTPMGEPLTGGAAFSQMLHEVQVDEQLAQLKEQFKTVTSMSKKDAYVKQIKYLSGLKSMDMHPQHAYMLSNMPVLPPRARPVMQQAGNRTEYADVTRLYQDHLLVAKKLGALKEDFDDESLIPQREALYKGAKAIFGLGDPISGSSRGHGYKGLLLQIAGTDGPKRGYFQSKIIGKKQDFSARATIYAEPNLGFNEMAVPKDMLWTLYEFHIIRDLAKQGYPYSEAKEAVKNRNPAAQASFKKMLTMVPIIANRAPTLMQSNITAHFAVPVEGKTLGVNPLHLPMYAGDFDGDAMTIHVPITPEAVEEAKKKLLPEHHIYDYRKGLNSSLIAPGHEAILGSMHMTEPDTNQEVHEFDTEEAVIAALAAGTIKVNTPIRLKTPPSPIAI